MSIETAFFLVNGLVIFLTLAFLFVFVRFTHNRLNYQKKAILAAQKINKIILGDLNFEAVAQKIADYIPSELKFATGVLAIYDKDRKVLRRIAASHTEEAEKAIQALRVPFTQIEISINDPNNLMARSLREKKHYTTTQVYDVLCPVLSAEEAFKIQSIMKTRTTLIYPLYMENEPIGVFVASTPKKESEITSYEYTIFQMFVDGSSIALQHALLYRNLTSATKQLKEANDQLQKLDQLKDEFVSLASHELRTPMTAIKSYLWMALAGRGGSLTKKQHYYLERAYNASDRLIKLVNDMLNISRIESGRIALNLEQVDIEKLTHEVYEEVLPRAEELGISITISHGINIPPVLADATKIKEVLINLIGNSLKFTPRGGSVVITFTSDQKFVTVSISDNGIGIPQEDMPKLFQKFGILPGSYTVNKNATVGTGLGLYICKSIVQMHGGKISAFSDGIGKGATFSFTLKKFADSDREFIANSQNKHQEVKELEHTIL
ncbi:MAG: hypothetical protein KatS3mg089_0660 [Patescibacteria group bacterium]|nr:MAG: hypothetical protein KatS3mg089_0660 [Patescibacteria group bacterium]